MAAGGRDAWGGAAVDDELVVVVSSSKLTARPRCRFFVKCVVVCAGLSRAKVGAAAS